MFNGHDINKGDKVRVVIGATNEIKLVTHVSQLYIYIQDKLFYKSSGRGANVAADGMRLERVK